MAGVPIRRGDGDADRHGGWLSEPTGPTAVHRGERPRDPGLPPPGPRVRLQVGGHPGELARWPAWTSMHGTASGFEAWPVWKPPHPAPRLGPAPHASLCVTFLCTMSGCPPHLGGSTGTEGLCPWLGRCGCEGWSPRVQSTLDQSPAKPNTPASHGFLKGLLSKGKGVRTGKSSRKKGGAPRLEPRCCL